MKKISRLEDLQPGMLAVVGIPFDANASFMRGPALGPAEGVDNSAKQHRLGKLGQGQCDVGEGEQPGEAPVRPELFKDAQIKTHKTHAPECSEFLR